MQENNAPFEIRQRVVAIMDGFIYSRGEKIKLIAKGDVFTIRDLWFCCKWRVDVGMTPARASVCADCNKSSASNINWANAKLFAPIDSRKVEIAEEILNSITITEEVPDKILKPETVNN